MTTNPNPVERIFIVDDRVKPETIAHHVARYKFAADMDFAFDVSSSCYLDLGSGTGYGTEIVRKRGFATAFGMEKDHKTYEQARADYPNCAFMEVDITKVASFPYFPVLVTMFEAIEHLTFKEGRSLIKTIENFMPPGGIFIMSTPRNINDKYNEFHKSEWSYGTIKNELGSVFSSVKIYGQDWQTAEISDENVRENDFYVAVAKK